MEIAGYELTVLEAGGFRLDGGGMFGVVPRTMWQERLKPDELNRVRIGTTCLLLRGHGRCVLIEAGYGDKLDARDREIYAIDNPGGILAVLAGLNIDPASIDAVVPSHLHFDHAGGLTRLDPSGVPVPSFPNARLFVQRQEWQDALSNHSHMKTTYRRENYQPVADAGLLELVDGPASILPNLRVEPAPGHTYGSQAVLIGESDVTLCFIGDISPTRHHLRPYWTTSYDVEPVTSNQTRACLVRQAIEQHWIIAFPHDPDTPLARAGLDAKGRWMTEPVVF